MPCVAVAVGFRNEHERLVASTGCILPLRRRRQAVLRAAAHAEPGDIGLSILQVTQVAASRGSNLESNSGTGAIPEQRRQTRLVAVRKHLYSKVEISYLLSAETRPHPHFSGRFLEGGGRLISGLGANEAVTWRTDTISGNNSHSVRSGPSSWPRGYIVSSDSRMPFALACTTLTLPPSSCPRLPRAPFPSSGLSRPPRGPSAGHVRHIHENSTPAITIEPSEPMAA